MPRSICIFESVEAAFEADHEYDMVASCSQAHFVLWNDRERQRIVHVT
jgi:hypothetical protein